MKRWHPLDRFNQWFSSAGGVWQTLIIVVALVVFEVLFPRVDNHGFWLLYWLTVYSAVTQPALAYSGKQSADRADLILHHVEQLLVHTSQIIEHLDIDAGDGEP